MNDQITTPTSLTSEHRLVGWGTFEDLSSSILALLFGHMVRLAAPVVEEYHSDLFHDAEWIRKNVTGPTSFDFVVRTSGTHVGQIARVAFDSYAPGGILYTLDLYPVTNGRSERNSDWWLRITEVDRAEKDVVGCSCGMADLGAPGHDQH